MATIKVKTSLATNSILEQSTDSIAVFVEQGLLESATIIDSLATTYFPGLRAAMAKQQFTGKPLTTLVVAGMRNGKTVDIILVGIGEKKTNAVIDPELYRRALGFIARIVEARKGTSLALLLPQATVFGWDESALVKQTTLLIQMALYHFDEYITDPERKLKDLKEVVLVVNGNDNKTLTQAMNDGNCIAESVNLCRSWIDTPAEHMFPEKLVTHAREIAQEHNLKFTEFSEKELCQMGMGGLCAVSKGSDRDCHMIIMEYKGEKNAPTLAIVGKGITFDSGGLSIKPADYMENMKDDMSGAAAVITTMRALAKLKPKINVIGVAPISENLPSGKATKPGDIATFYNGKTAEIRNTDAEGRLILADALAYTAKHYKPDAMIDIATLTGAAKYALGPHFTCMMGNNDPLVDRVSKAGATTGDKVWRLPLPEDYKNAIKSGIADIKNTGSPKYMAGTITGALFLQNFVEDVPWVHLDIAATAYDVPDISYFRPESATGAGVRLVIELAMSWQ
ncbi:MAG TPA: leucyl aminopeptidase [Candidatus Babeliales bacterium]|nr:leucyl aminopeptidase [Candidatus Babeliales bacterium]